MIKLTIVTDDIQYIIECDEYFFNEEYKILKLIKPRGSMESRSMYNIFEKNTLKNFSCDKLILTNVLSFSVVY